MKLFNVWDNETNALNENISAEIGKEKYFWFIRATNDTSPKKEIESLDNHLRDNFQIKKEIFSLEDNEKLLRLKQVLRGRKSETQRYKIKALLYK